MLKKADIGVGLYLLAAVVFFIVPIPSVLLDVMLAFNISIALIIVFNVLFVREVLDMSFFPTLLLFTTIFRISLNVSSTRLILLTGDPGNICCNCHLSSFFMTPYAVKSTEFPLSLIICVTSLSSARSCIISLSVPLPELFEPL